MQRLVGVAVSTDGVEMAKTSGLVKNSSPVPKTTSPRDSQADHDTELVVSSDEIERARDAVDSISSETATIDCHPVILDDTEEETDRFVGADASSSGLVTKPVKRPPRPGADEKEHEDTTDTISAPKPQPLLADGAEEIEISLSGDLAPIEGTPTREKIAPPPRATITQSLDDDTATEERKPVPRFDDETMPMPKPNLVDIGGALETVPLNAALVQNVIAQVDARKAARDAGKPVPAPAQSPRHAQTQALVQTHPSATKAASDAMRSGRHPAAPPPPRRLGVEIVITVIAFLAVAVPALYWLYLSFMR